ncbi:MAG: hypothetical protein L0Y68_00180 [Candidatus Dadabacteria bacterium]|nr:hypothetical protein [Candidatus Dadabacteria bacterium]
MTKGLVLLSILSLFVFSCTKTNVAVPKKTQLQVRQFQTRTYDTKNTKMVMKALFNVLQDDGFIVKNAVVDLGLLTAEKEVDIESSGVKFFALFFMGANASWEKSLILEATANVSEFGEQTKVRMNFQAKVLDNAGRVLSVEQVQDEKFYQDFFSKVDKGIFIEKERI